MLRMRYLLLLLVLATACSSEASPVTITSTTAATSDTVDAAPVITSDQPVTVDTSALPAETTVPPSTVLGSFAPVLTPVAAGFAQPVFLDAPVGDDRLFIVDQTGVVFVIDGGDPMTFLDITDRVRMAGEQGLLGLAFDPADVDRFFLHYTDAAGSSVVEGFTGAANGSPISSGVVLTVEQPASNHNGGMLAFGPDGYLWIALGDGGRANDAFNNGQRPDTLLGTLLRIDVRADPYVIPASNPFADGVLGDPEVYFFGLRNPWRFSFDGTDVWIGDVGQGELEEVDRLPVTDAGANLGWPIFEGTDCFRSPCAADGLVVPVTEYRHSDGCSITGGYVYRGEALPEFVGQYFFGDFCTGFIRTFDPATGDVTDWSEQLGTVSELTSFGTDGHGNLYVLSGQGTIYRIDRS